jgi:hypothetical protein
MTEELFALTRADLLYLRRLLARFGSLLSPTKGRVHETPRGPREPTQNFATLLAATPTNSRWPAKWVWRSTDSQTWNDGDSLVTTAFTGNTTSGSDTVTSLSVSPLGWTVGDAITGTNMPADAVVKEISSGTQIKITGTATGTGTGVSLSRLHDVWLEAPNGEALQSGVHYLARAGDDDGAGTAVYTVVKGPASTPAFSGGYIGSSSNISVANGAGYTTLSPLATTGGGWDTGGYFNGSNNSRIVAPVAGYYLLTGSAQWTFDANASQHRLKAQLNGASSLYEDVADATAAGDAPTNEFSRVVKLAASDYVELLAKHGSGVAINVAPTLLQLTLLGT